MIDEGASDEQAQALERILTGQAGGPFADLFALVSDYLGTQRAAVAFSDGEAPTASIGGMGDLGVELLRGVDGSPTTVSNAMLGFAPTFRIGRGTGSVDALGVSWQASYGEAAEYEYSSEMTAEEVKPRGL